MLLLQAAEAPDTNLFSPRALLRHITSPEYREAQAETWRRVRSSYEVGQHRGSGTLQFVV